MHCSRHTAACAADVRAAASASATSLRQAATDAGILPCGGASLSDSCSNEREGLVAPVAPALGGAVVQAGGMRTPGSVCHRSQSKNSIVSVGAPRLAAPFHAGKSVGSADAVAAGGAASAGGTSLPGCRRNALQSTAGSGSPSTARVPPPGKSTVANAAPADAIFAWALSATAMPEPVSDSSCRSNRSSEEASWLASSLPMLATHLNEGPRHAQG